MKIEDFVAGRNINVKHRHFHDLKLSVSVFKAETFSVTVHWLQVSRGTGLLHFNHHRLLASSSVFFLLVVGTAQVTLTGSR